jgi:hypothetical protein
MTDFKYYIKRFWAYLLVLVISIVILGILNQKNKFSNEIFFGGIATLLSLYFSIINYHQTSDRFFKELFTDFNDRYNKLNNFLNSVEDNQVLTLQQEQYVIDYLNLCAEEYLWVKKGRIPSNIWKSWKNGIRIYLLKKPIKELFDKERELWKSSYYGFFEEIGK